MGKLKAVVIKGLLAANFIIIEMMVITGCSEEQASDGVSEVVRPAKIVLAEPITDVETRVFPGTLESAKQSDLSFRLGGRIELLPALPGKAFKKGELLAALDESEYQNAVRDREARYKLAKSQYEKVVKLFEQNHVSKISVDEVEASLKASRAALNVAQDNLKHTRLLAPFDGVVSSLKTENYQVVSAHETILHFRAEDQLDVRFNIPERLVSKLKTIDDLDSLCVSVRFNDYPSKSYPACFKEFDSTPDRLTRSYSAVYRMPEISEFKALPGMAVTAEIDFENLYQEENVQGVLVPLSSVFEESGQEYVWCVKNNGDVEKRQVKSVEIQREKMLITSGLDPNESIVAVGVSYIHEGMRVRAMVKERGL